MTSRWGAGATHRTCVMRPVALTPDDVRAEIKRLYFETTRQRKP
jgi:hypothetical protein